MSEQRPENLCLVPWTGFSNDPNGKVRPCCIFKGYIEKENSDPYYVQESSLKEIMSSEYMKTLRTEFRNNEKPTPCSTCWNDEDCGRKSKRITYNEEVSKEHSEIDWKSEPELPIEYQMIISNSCNLKCRSCGPSHSSLWQQEHNKYHGHTGYEMIHGQPGNDESVLWKDRHSWYPHLRRLEVVGGEPMYIKKWHQIFNELIEGGYAKDIVLDMSSNANIFLKDELYYWADNFKRVGIGLSVDGTGVVYNYMRSAGNWFKVWNNMEKYHTVMEYYHASTGKPASRYGYKKLFVQVSFTLSWLNALELPKMHKILREKFPLFKIWNNLVYAPEWMSLRYAPQELKDLIKQNWSEFDWGDYQKDIDGFINFMNMPSADEDTFKYFMSKCSSLDAARNDSLFNIVPEYRSVLEKYVTKSNLPYFQTNTIPIVEIK